MKAAQGTVFRFGDNIDTDVIIPARYLNTTDAKELAKHCMEDIDKEFASKVNEGDIIVADKNFGCGSSREHAPIAIKASGVSCVIAKSFARIFYRNSINIGLPIIECEEAADKINRAKESGHRVICTGTTSCRTIESAADENGHLTACSGDTSIFIYPGYKFKVLDQLITNFHLPESTLVMLVSALAGRKHVLAAYEEAIKARYRFFSHGACILRTATPESITFIP